MNQFSDDTTLYCTLARMLYDRLRTRLGDGVADKALSPFGMVLAGEFLVIARRTPRSQACRMMADSVFPSRRIARNAWANSVSMTRSRLSVTPGSSTTDWWPFTTPFSFTGSRNSPQR